MQAVSLPDMDIAVDAAARIICVREIPQKLMGIHDIVKDGLDRQSSLITMRTD